MDSLSKCVACGAEELETGFIPDAGDMHSVVIMGWHAGEPEDFKVFGMKTGSVRTDSPRTPITAKRCQRCGFLHMFAKPG